MPFDGTKMLFSQMCDLSGDSSSYQYATLFLQNVGGTADATTSTSSITSSLRDLDYPILPFDATTPYGSSHALGLFTFYTSDGTSINLISLDRSE